MGRIGPAGAAEAPARDRSGESAGASVIYIDRWNFCVQDPVVSPAAPAPGCSLSLMIILIPCSNGIIMCTELEVSFEY